MKLHDNAKTTPKTRELLVDRVLQREWDVESVAEAAGVSTRTVWKWLWRYREESAAGVGTLLALCEYRRPRRPGSRGNGVSPQDARWDPIAGAGGMRLWRRIGQGVACRGC